MAPGPLYTIGYQGAALEQFLACLAANGVRTLADIRFAPFSRRPEFRQNPLRTAVERAGLSYKHFKSLGNPPESRAAAEAGDQVRYRTLFQAHLDTDTARTSLAQIVSALVDGPVCLMCLERRPEDCHRSMVAEWLARTAGVAVVHLHPADQPSPGQPSPAQPLLL